MSKTKIESTNPASLYFQINFLKEEIEKEADQQRKENLSNVLKTMKAVESNFATSKADGFVIFVPIVDFKKITELLTPEEKK